MRALSRLGLILLTTAAAGCVVGPRYRAPGAPASARGAFQTPAPNVAASQPLPARWWRLYDDARLDALVEQALTENADLKTAQSNLLYAQAVLREAEDGRYPGTTLTSQASFGKAFLPTKLLTTPRTYELAGFSASYQVDLFGRLTQTIRAARADAEAAAATRDLVRVTVAAATASAYANACGYGEQIAAARESLAIVQHDYDLTVSQRDAGALSDVDVDRERVLLEQTRAAIPPLDGAKRAQIYVLTALIGETPDHAPAAAVACAAPPRLDRPLPVGDGAALIKRRPDVRAAERQLAAATADIGVATAALYPSITLGGAYNTGAATPAGLGRVANTLYNIGPLVSWNVPNLLIARDHIREANAEAQGALANFDSTVLKALSETEQALSVYEAELAHHKALVAAQVAAQAVLKPSNVQFRAGSYSLIDFLNVQASAVSANQAVAASDQALAADQIAVFQALGGGWEEAPPVTPPPPPR